MFNLVRMHDIVKIQPSEFSKDVHDAIVEAINCKYTNKVVLETGLCMQLYDVLSIGDVYLYPGSAARHVEVRFRLLVFRPFVGEVVLGTVLGTSKQGVTVSLGFFEDVLIPIELMWPTVEWDDVEKTLCWKNELGDFYIDTGEHVRFRVAEIVYNGSTTFAERPGSSVANCGGMGAGVLGPGVPGCSGAASAAGAGSSALAGGAGQAGSAGAAHGARGAAGAAPSQQQAGAFGSAAKAAASLAGGLVGMPGGAPHGLGRQQPMGGPRAAPFSAAEAAPYRPPMALKGAMNEDGLGLLSWWPGEDSNSDGANPGEGFDDDAA